MVDSAVTVVGNCTREPELRFTPGGFALVTFGVAVNRRWRDRATEELREAVSFFDVKVWGPLAENVAHSVVKGCRVVVEGRLEQETWDDAATGEKRSKVVVVAEEVGPSLRFATAVVTRVPRPAAEPAPGRPVAVAS
jgi:single-strand DNA-binding protein